MSILFCSLAFGHGGDTLGSGDYIPKVADHPTHTAVQPVPPPPTIDWSTVDASSRVLIQDGASVPLSGSVEADEIKVDGALILDPTANVELKVTTLQVGATGKLVSRPNQGIKHTVTFRDKPFAASDLESITHGLIVLGEIDVQGEPKTPYTRLAATASGSTVKLDSVPADWAVGDELIFPDSSPTGIKTKYAGRERRRIAAISGDEITLDAPLTNKHEGIKDWEGKVVAYPPIANLTRSVVFRSENPDGVRGHGLYGGDAKVSLRCAAFKDMGRTRALEIINSTVRDGDKIVWKGTNQNGRYAIHLHHSRTPATVEGNVIDGAPKWGIAIHNSHENRIERNVVADCIGAGIVTEDGNETNNHIEGNFIIGCDGAGTHLQTRGDTSPKMILKDGKWVTVADLGHEGVGIWMHGQSNYVVGNIILNTVKPATQTWTRIVADMVFPHGTANPRDFVFPAFDDNEIWYCNSGFAFDGVAPPEVVRFKNNSMYGVYSGGVDASYSGRFDFDGLTVIGLNRPNSQGFSHQFLTSIRGRNWNIQNMESGSLFTTNFDIADSFFGCNLYNCLNINSNGVNSGDTIVGTLRNVKHAKAKFKIASLWHPVTPAVNHLEPRAMYVYAHNQVVGDDFQLLMREQSADFLLPSSGMSDDAITGVQTIQNFDRSINVPSNARLSPAALTNGALFAKYGVALAGKVASGTTTRPDILGLVSPLPVDTTPPAFSAVSVEHLTPTSVRVKWRTDEPATSAVEYDREKMTSQRFGRFASADLTLKTEHAITLTGLEPNTPYAWRPYSQDAAGNTGFIWGAGSREMDLPTFKTEAK